MEQVKHGHPFYVLQNAKHETMYFPYMRHVVMLFVNMHTCLPMARLSLSLRLEYSN